MERQSMEKKRLLNAAIPKPLYGVPVLVCVGACSFLFYLAASALLNGISDKINFDIRGLIYIVMFAADLFLYCFFGRRVFRNRKFVRRERWSCVAVTEAILVVLQLSVVTGVPVLGFLSVWIGGLGYIILYFYSLLSALNLLGLLMAYVLGLMIPAICILYFSGEKSYVHR